MSNINTGKEGENEALRFLKNLGYDILEQNFRAGRYEVDIIAKEGSKIIFVEVKTLNGKGLPELKVDNAKKHSMTEVARYYCQAVKHDGNIRFDVVSIVFFKFGKQIMHFPDVFYPMQTGI